MTGPKLWKHQEEAIKRATAPGMSQFALFFDVGTGKSRTLIEILMIKYFEFSQIVPTLIVCPPVVINNWVNEFEKFSNFSSKHLVPLTGTQTQRIKKLDAAPEDSVFITNYESLGIMPPLLSALKARFHKKPFIMVLDEMHKIKSHNSKRTKRAIELSQYATFRYGLTGTPYLSSLLDLYSQYLFLDHGRAFGTSYYAFLKRYFVDKNAYMPKSRHFPDYVPAQGTREKMITLTQHYTMSANRHECIDLPPLLKQEIHVEMSYDQKRMYESMRSEMIAEIKNEESGKTQYSVANLAVTKALRLMQILSGHVRVELDGKEETVAVKIKDNPRLSALRELLEVVTASSKVIIWAVFKDNFDDIRNVCEYLKLEYAEIHGEITNKDAEIKKFKTDPACKVLFGHPKAGGIGITLTEARVVIFYTRQFSLEDDIQAEARCYRAGSTQHASIMRYDFVTPGTVDELALKSVKEKTEVSNAILKEYLLN